MRRQPAAEKSMGGRAGKGKRARLAHATGSINRYPTPHSFSTYGVSVSAASLRRSREAWESSVRVRPS